MRFIREYRRTYNGEYVYEFMVNGICTEPDPIAFNLISTIDGPTRIEETPFLELWNYADNCEMEIKVTTEFEYRQMMRSSNGIFVFVISEVLASDAAIFTLKFGDYIIQRQ